MDVKRTPSKDFSSDDDFDLFDMVLKRQPYAVVCAGETLQKHPNAHHVKTMEAAMQVPSISSCIVPYTPVKVEFKPMAKPPDDLDECPDAFFEEKKNGFRSRRQSGLDGVKKNTDDGGWGIQKYWFGVCCEILGTDCSSDDGES